MIYIHDYVVFKTTQFLTVKITFHKPLTKYALNELNWLTNQTNKYSDDWPYGATVCVSFLVETSGAQ